MPRLFRPALCSTDQAERVEDRRARPDVLVARRSVRRARRSAPPRPRLPARTSASASCRSASTRKPPSWVARSRRTASRSSSSAAAMLPRRSSSAPSIAAPSQPARPLRSPRRPQAPRDTPTRRDRGRLFTGAAAGDRDGRTRTPRGCRSPRRAGRALRQLARARRIVVDVREALRAAPARALSRSRRPSPGRSRRWPLRDGATRRRRRPTRRSRRAPSGRRGDRPARRRATPRALRRQPARTRHVTVGEERDLGQQHERAAFEIARVLGAHVLEHRARLLACGRPRPRGARRPGRRSNGGGASARARLARWNRERATANEPRRSDRRPAPSSAAAASWARSGGTAPSSSAMSTAARSRW